MGAGEPDVARWLATAFGLGEAVEMLPTARGAMGAVWRLKTTAGVFAAKELFWFDGDLAAVRAEVAFRAACAEVGVRSPEPLAGVDGEYVVRRGEGWWRLYEWAEGEVPDGDDVEVACWVASQMAVIHTLDWPGGEVEIAPWYHRVDVDWAALIEAADQAKIAWAVDLRELRPRLGELTALVNAMPTGEQVWCHRDLANSNVLRATVAGGNWLVDWDNVGPLAPERELGALLLREIERPEAFGRVLSAYRKAGGPAEIDGPGGFATGVAIWLNFLHGQGMAALDTELAEQHREYAEEQVCGLLVSLPELATLQRAAEAARR
ncbi:phosphotransferase [Kribbella sp. NPDC056861]|uniref:phosphotransferase enzyme family protein n=1 Tax=Kribbella sp. NPDC056861 TaxID=3154857 RepID=UPI0034355620